MAMPNVTAADVRAYARWPEAVTDDFLTRHLAGAVRDVGHAVGNVIPDGYDADAAEAVTALAAASALPFVQTFTLDAAASALRSAQLTTNKPHFQGAADQQRTIAALRARAEDLIARMVAAQSTNSADTFSANGIFMGAI